jgi:hypothetical protein
LLTGGEAAVDDRLLQARVHVVAKKGAGHGDGSEWHDMQYIAGWTRRPRIRLGRRPSDDAEPDGSLVNGRRIQPQTYEGAGRSRHAPRAPRRPVA